MKAISTKSAFIKSSDSGKDLVRIKKQFRRILYKIVWTEREVIFHL